MPSTSTLSHHGQAPTSNGDFLRLGMSVAFCAWSGPWSSEGGLTPAGGGTWAPTFCSSDFSCCSLGVLSRLGTNVLGAQREPRAVVELHLDPGVHVASADLAAGLGLGAHDDPRRDAEPLPDERQGRGVLLVVAGELGGVDEPARAGRGAWPGR